MARGHGTPIGPVAAYFQPPSSSDPSSPAKASGALATSIASALTGAATGRALASAGAATAAGSTALGSASGKASASGAFVADAASAEAGAATGRALASGTLVTRAASPLSGAAIVPGLGLGALATSTGGALTGVSTGRALSAGAPETASSTPLQGSAQGDGTAATGAGAFATSVSSPADGVAFGPPAVVVSHSGGSAWATPHTWQPPQKRMQRRLAVARGELAEATAVAMGGFAVGLEARAAVVLRLVPTARPAIAGGGFASSSTTSPEGEGHAAVRAGGDFGDGVQTSASEGAAVGLSILDDPPRDRARLRRQQMLDERTEGRLEHRLPNRPKRAA